MALRLTVIGAGPGGYAAAFDAAARGARVTLIEGDRLGGTCLNRGCIPTKTLKTSAEKLDDIRQAASFGIKVGGGAAIDLPALIARKRAVIDTLRTGLEKTCAGLGVDVVHGRGRLVDAHRVVVATADGGEREIPGDAVVVATGSKVLDMPSVPCDGTRILSSDGALELTEVPGTLLVVGGGVVGMELAFIFRSFGSKVTVVEGQHRLLPVPSVDEAMSRLIQREARKRGIGVELCRTVLSAGIDGDRVVAELGPSPFVDPALVPASAKKPATVEADRLFMTVGRVPNTDGLGLAEAGVETDRRGYVKVDGALQTSVPGVFAVGDVLGPDHVMLAHVATAEAHAVVRTLFGDRTEMDYSVVPSGIFCSPEIGDVGLTEAQAVAGGIEVRTAEFAFRELGKAHAMGELAGTFKLVAEAATGRLLGAHVAGAHATDLIAEAALAVRYGHTASELAGTIHAHPTLAEGMMEVAAKLAR